MGYTDSFQRYRRLVKSSNPGERKVLYKLREARLKKEIKERYERPEKIKERIGKILSKKLSYKKVLRKQPTGTVVFSSAQSRSKHFKEEYEKARWF